MTSINNNIHNKTQLGELKSVSHIIALHMRQEDLNMRVLTCLCKTVFDVVETLQKI